MPARLAVNEAFYGGPLWKEHGPTRNDRLVDHTNVLLLQPLTPDRALPMLPAVDLVREPASARGAAVAQVLAVAPDGVATFVKEAENAFVSYREAGIREAGVLVTLDAPNNFPRHPIRTDSPHVVWLGLAEDEGTIDARFTPLAERLRPGLAATGCLRRASEEIVLVPGARSRLRWL